MRVYMRGDMVNYIVDQWTYRDVKKQMRVCWGCDSDV